MVRFLYDGMVNSFRVKSIGLNEMAMIFKYSQPLLGHWPNDPLVPMDCFANECHNSMSCLDESKEGSGSMHQVFRQVTSFFNNVFLIRQGKQETPVEK